MPPALLNGHELAEQLDASYDEVMAWQRKKIIPSIKAGGRIYFNLRLVVDALRRHHAERLRSLDNSRELAGVAR